MGPARLLRIPSALATVIRSVDRPLAVLSLAGFISPVGVAVMLPLLPSTPGSSARRP